MNLNNGNNGLHPYPKQLYIESTNRCNSKCSTCIRTYRQYELPKDFSLSELKSIVEQFPELERVALHGGGEPLMNAEIHSMVRYLKSRGANVLFNSNALLLDDETNRELIESGLDEFRVSLDAATAETYFTLRGIPHFEKAVGNVRALVELKRTLGTPRPRVSFWFVGTRENIMELPDLVRLAADIGVQEVYMQRLIYFLPADSEGIALEEMSIYQDPDQEILEAIKEAEEVAGNLGVSISSSGATTPVKSLQKQRPGKEFPWGKCKRPWTVSYITANGNVLPCCLSPSTVEDYNSIILGNVFEDRFMDIWNGEEYRVLRKQLRSPDPVQACKGCGVRWSL